MDSAKYKKIVSEVWHLLDKEDIEDALEIKKSSARIGRIQDLLRVAIQKSSLGVFNGNPYFFNGRIYEYLGDNDFGNLIYDVLKRCKLPSEDMMRLEGVIKVCRRAVYGKHLRPDNGIMIFRNGVLDMDKKKLCAFNKKFVQMTEVEYDYDAEEIPFQWKIFIEEVLPSPTIRKIFQEFLGCIFIDRDKAKIETMMVLRGSGSNGKSVVFETIMGILGRDNVSNFGLGALISGNERKKNIAFINGKRLNYCSEIQALEIGKESDTMKALISGEPTEARPIYGNNFTAHNIPLLMANANQMPFMRDWSYGMRRRLYIIPFEVEIPRERQRKTLADELKAEYPAIFNWIIEGRDRFVANNYKFTKSERLEEIMDEYQAESNSVLDFMYKHSYFRSYEDVVDAEPEWVNSSILYRRYEKWCFENGVHTETTAAFGRILNNAGYRKKRLSKGHLYAIYGNITCKRRYQKKDKTIINNYSDEERVKHKKMPVNCALTEEEIRSTGYKRYAIGYDGLAGIIKVCKKTLATWMRKGIFEGCYTKFGEDNKYIFDLDSTIDKLIEYGKIKATWKKENQKKNKSKKALIKELILEGS